MIIYEDMIDSLNDNYEIQAMGMVFESYMLEFNKPSGILGKIKNLFTNIIPNFIKTMTDKIFKTNKKIKDTKDSKEYTDTQEFIFSGFDKYKKITITTTFKQPDKSRYNELTKVVTEMINFIYYYINSFKYDAREDMPIIDKNTIKKAKEFMKKYKDYSKDGKHGDEKSWYINDGKILSKKVTYDENLYNDLINYTRISVSNLDDDQKHLNNLQDAVKNASRALQNVDDGYPAQDYGEDVAKDIQEYFTIQKDLILNYVSHMMLIETNINNAIFDNQLNDARLLAQEIRRLEKENK